jgi:hypothetical protein
VSVMTTEEKTTTARFERLLLLLLSLPTARKIVICWEVVIVMITAVDFFIPFLRLVLADTKRRRNDSL